MTPDEPQEPRTGSSERPDPSFIKRLEDDELWSDPAPRTERRVDRYADRNADRNGDRYGDRYVNRRVDRRTARSRHANDPTYGRKPSPKRTSQRSRRIAVVVLVLAVIVVLIVGLELTQSNGGASGSTPFSLLPLDSGAITSTTGEGGTSTTSSLGTSTTGGTGAPSTGGAATPTTAPPAVPATQKTTTSTTAHQ